LLEVASPRIQPLPPTVLRTSSLASLAVTRTSDIARRCVPAL